MSSPIAGLPVYADTSPNTPWLNFNTYGAKLDPLVVQHFATTTDRNNAFAAMVTAGGTMQAGILCTVAGTVCRSLNSSPTAWELLGAVRGGVVTATTSGGGDVLIAHGLPSTPIAAWVSPYGVGNDAIYGKAVISSISSSVLSVRLYDTRSGAVLAGYSGAQFMWGAVAL